MSRCVPCWGDNNPFADTFSDNLHLPNYPPDTASTPTKLILSRNLDSNDVVPNFAAEVPKLDYEVAELTWENGQLALHGLGQPRMPTRLETSRSASGTLESIVNQATCLFIPFCNDKPLTGFPPAGDELVPGFKFNQHTHAAAAAGTMTMDALVPLCSNTNNNNNINKANRAIITFEDSNEVPGGFKHVESCSSGMNSQSVRQARRVPVVARDWSTRTSEYSAKRSRQQITGDTCTEWDQGTAFTSTSIWSADNTSSGMVCTKLTGSDDHDSICHSRSIMKDYGRSDETKKKGSSTSVKRSRAAVIHNQSERKRREKINQRMKTLQKLVPNSNKIDKASMLDEVMEYLKQLQAQVTMINRMNMNMPQMTMMPMTLNQQVLPMSIMTPMCAGAMGMGGMLDMNAAAAVMAAGRVNMSFPPPLMHPSAFMPMQPVHWDPVQAIMPDPMSAFLARQSQPMTMDSYRMMASLHHQHMQQTQQLIPNSKAK